MPALLFLAVTLVTLVAAPKERRAACVRTQDLQLPVARKALLSP